MARAAAARRVPAAIVFRPAMGVPVVGLDKIGSAGLRTSWSQSSSVVASPGLAGAPAPNDCKRPRAVAATPDFALASPAPVLAGPEALAAAEEISRAAAARPDAPAQAEAEQDNASRRIFDGAAALPAPADPVAVLSDDHDAPFAALARAGRDIPERPHIRLLRDDESAKKKAARRVFVGTGIYKFGMEALNITMPLIALTFFGSTIWMATMATGWGLAMTLSSMLAGGVIDRKPVQKVLATALLAQAGIVAGIIFLFAAGAANPWLILPLLTLAGATQGAVLTARDCLSALTVGRNHDSILTQNIKVHMYYEIAGVIAPLAVGLLLRNSAALIGVNVLAGLCLLPPAYILAAWVFWRLKLAAPPGGRQGATPPSRSLKDMIQAALSDIRAGKQIILGQKEFRWLGFMIVGPMILHRLLEQIMIPIFAKNVLDSAEKSAWMISSSSAGELLSAALLLLMLRFSRADHGTVCTKKPSPFSWIRVMALSSLLLWTFAVGAGVNLWLLLGVIMASSLTLAANDLSLHSYFQSRLPNEAAGKATGFLMAIQLGSIMAISCLLGFLFELLPIHPVFVGLCAAISILAALFYRGYAKLREAAKNRS